MPQTNPSRQPRAGLPLRRAARHPVPAVLLVAVCALAIAGCGDGDPEHVPELRVTLDELLLQDARRCDSGFTYPQALIDGLGLQLVEELRCLDDRWLVFYTPCREPGCVWAEGPQPLAMRPEALEALEDAAASKNDFITITAAYRDVAMQYYSRWYNENCDRDFDAAVPGSSNHQGGRAIDVKFYNFWWDTLLDFGWEHPIPTDAPHFEFIGPPGFRDESEALKRLSVTAFQRLWNRNHPDDPIAEDGVYTAETKARLGRSPVEGFPIGACRPGSGGGDDPDVGLPDAGDAGVATDAASPDATPEDARSSDAPTPDTLPTDVRPSDPAPSDVLGPDTVPTDTSTTDAPSSDAASPDGSIADAPAPGDSDANGDAGTRPDRDSGGRTDARPEGSAVPLERFPVAGRGAASAGGCAASAAAPGGGLALVPALLFGASWRRRRRRS